MEQTTLPRARPASDYTDLARQMQDAGLMQRRYGYYSAKVGGLVLAMAGAGAAFVLLGDSWWQLVVAAVLAVLLTQLAFLGHDAAHRQIFVSGRRNEWAALVLVDLLSGFSAGWWTHKHTKHHAAPNQEGKDPDIGPGVLAFTPAVAAERGAVGGFLAARQGWFFFPLLLLEGLNLHAQSITLLCGRSAPKRRWTELSFIALRLGSYVAVLLLMLPLGMAAAFLAVQLGLFGLYMGASFAPNHKGMPLVPPGLKVDFLRRQVLMSRNISGGRAMSFAMGGLDHQIEHHLFPSMPRPNLRKARDIVRPYLRDRGVHYTEMSLLRSYGTVVRYLNQVGLGAGRDPFQCPLVTTYRHAA